MFGTRNGTELDAHNVRRAFRRIAAAAGLDPAAWTPRELRHSFVSLLSDSGMPLEQIARLLGHNGTAVTERVYRHQLRPVLEEGAAAMDGIFGDVHRGSHSSRWSCSPIRSAGTVPELVRGSAGPAPYAERAVTRLGRPPAGRRVISVV